jgi:cytochrome P450
LPIAPIDPFAPAVRANPYPLYARLRQLDPLHRSASGAWVVTRHADCAALLADERFAHWQFPAPRRGGATELERILSHWLELMIPGRRSRLRALTTLMFAPARIAALTAETEAFADALAAKCAAAGRFDVVSAFADPLTFTVTGQQLGIAPHDIPRFIRLAAAMRGSLFQVLGGRAVAPEQETAANEFSILIRQSVAAKEEHRRGDLMTALFEARDEGDALDTADFVALSMVFLFAGHENTTNFIAGAVRTLLNDRKWRHGSDSATAIEELLRFESPVQYVSLTAREPVAVTHGSVNAGEQILVSIGAANRDPEVFADAEKLDLTRDPNPHLALGHGPFTCIGAAVARMEARVALRALLRHCPGLALESSEAAWRDGPPVLRGLRELPVHT